MARCCSSIKPCYPPRSWSTSAAPPWRSPRRFARCASAARRPSAWRPPTPWRSGRASTRATSPRRFLQGARLTAWELHAEGIPLTLIADNMAGYFMARGQIDLVVVGADRIAANGDVANKIGTYSVAVLAHAHGIPFYVAAPTSTCDLSLSTGESIPIEQRAASEITHGFGKATAPEGIDVYNPAFDVTPA